MEEMRMIEPDRFEMCAWLRRAGAAAATEQEPKLGNGLALT
jgi:hypothetical protein